MNVQLTEKASDAIEADAVVLGVFTDEPLGSAAAAIDQAAEGVISRLLESEEISTEPFRTTQLLAVPGIAAQQVVCVGLGSREDCHTGLAFRAAAAASKTLTSKQRDSIAFYFGELEDDVLSAAIAGSLLGCRGQDLYRSEPNRFAPETLLWASASESALNVGRILGESVNLTRRLVNEPADVIYPESFAAQAEAVASEFGIEAEIWDGARLEQERCGALLAVARGSSREPRLAILRYRGASEDQPMLAFVGKGVTFDSGGLSLKPSEGMKTMKCDMAGAATVLGAIRAIAALKLPVNVTAYMGLVENMTGAASYKLGDVLTARNGTTIEIHNTDAEGRLVLADALSVAVDDGAAQIIDVATLTGACVVALGLGITGVMTNDGAICDQLMEAADACGEPTWELPMFSEFSAQISSQVADIKNTGEGRWGGAITAAKLLEEFVDDVPWVHLDIAGPAFADKPAAWHDGGATGVMVRSLVEFARRSGE